ncbi:hypothetical protein JL721_3986 [Aureococcus anophagefferens]|nr:hypothetical protein JL721_3986 [Aureococcus anophagefferens]
MMASSDTPPTACRWRILATVIVVESVSGLMYAFGIYSARLKSKFSLSQEQLDAISISSSLGSNVGVHWACSRTPRPSAALCAALVAGGGGWLLLWSALGGVSGCGGCLAYLCARAAPGHGHVRQRRRVDDDDRQGLPAKSGPRDGSGQGHGRPSAALRERLRAVAPALRLYVLLVAGCYVGACAFGAARLRAGDILAAGARERPEDDAPRLARILARVVGLAVFYLALQLANAFAPVPAAGRYATGACARCWRSSAASSAGGRWPAAAPGGRRGARGPRALAPVRARRRSRPTGARISGLWFVCFAVCGSGTVVANNLTQIAKARGHRDQGRDGPRRAALHLQLPLPRRRGLRLGPDRGAGASIQLHAAVASPWRRAPPGAPGLKGSVYVLSVLSGAPTAPSRRCTRSSPGPLRRGPPRRHLAAITAANGLGSYLGSNVLAARLYDAANAPGHQVCESSRADVVRPRSAGASPTRSSSARRSTGPPRLLRRPGAARGAAADRGPRGGAAAARAAERVRDEAALSAARRSSRRERRGRLRRRKRRRGHPRRRKRRRGRPRRPCRARASASGGSPAEPAARRRRGLLSSPREAPAANGDETWRLRWHEFDGAVLRWREPDEAEWLGAIRVGSDRSAARRRGALGGLRVTSPDLSMTLYATTKADGRPPAAGAGRSSEDSSDASDSSSDSAPSSRRRWAAVARAAAPRPRRRAAPALAAGDADRAAAAAAAVDDYVDGASGTRLAAWFCGARASAALTDEVYCRLLLVAANRRRPNRKRKAWELLAAVSRRRCRRRPLPRQRRGPHAAIAQDQDDAATAAATYADADVVLRG